MKLKLTQGKQILRLPQQDGAVLRNIMLLCDGICKAKISVPLAVTRIDSWQYLRLSDALCNAELELLIQDSIGILEAAELLTDTQYLNCVDRLSHGVHCPLPFGHETELKHVYRCPRGWALSFSDGFGESGYLSRVIHADNSVFFHTTLVEEPQNGKCRVAFGCTALSGDVCQRISVENGDGSRLAFAVCRNEAGKYLSLPYLVHSGSDVQLHPQLEQLRMWERKWSMAGNEMHCPLRFALKPARWPNIRIAEAQCTPDDITAEAFEAEVKIPSAVDKLEISLPWSVVTIDRVNGKILCGENTLALPHNSADILLHLVFDSTATEIFCEGNALICSVCGGGAAAMQSVDNSISGNLEKCALDVVDIPMIRVHTNTSSACGVQIKVYGLHGLEYSIPALAALARRNDKSRLIYTCPEFALYSDRVQDACYNLADAYVVSDDTVVSPTRVTEEFEWRDTPWGDMTRADDHGDIWHATSSLRRYPVLHSDAVCLTAAWNIALDVFRKCSDQNYAIPGQQDMWSAGVFQGRGESFGVWLRDSAHVALRCGSLIDPDTCLRTLKYAAAKGFDNGSDGPAMLPVSLWDYSLATGNKSALFELLPELLSNAQAIDSRFDESTGLVRAAQSTSNDAFPEPETGGFALGSECYYMKAYEALSEIGRATGCGEELISHWQSRADMIRQRIQSEYWNDTYGYFTSGPRGSRAFDNGVWESSGIEAAIWSKFGIANKQQISSVLGRLEHSAMSPYGIILFPNRPEKNHFVGPVWGVWQAGFASAAARARNDELLLRLLSQQIRNALLNKSFYEVLESESGKAWRWPGQLWHAAGFVSLVLYGLLGITYDANGMTFSPCIPAQFGNISVERLNYRAASINIHSHGSGTDFHMLLDGCECDHIPADIEGEHNICLMAVKV